MQSYLTHKSFICYNCLHRLAVVKTFTANITTKTPKLDKIVTKNIAKSKTKDKLHLKAKQFPRLLKDLEKLDKKLSSVSKSSLQDNDSDIASHYVESEANQELIEETEPDSITKDWMYGNDGLNSYNVLSPEVDEITDFIERPDDNVFLENDSKINLKEKKNISKNNKLLRKQEEIRQQLREIEIKSKATSLKYSLKSYIYSCIYSDMISKAHSVLIYYRNKNLKSMKMMKNRENWNSVHENPIDVSVYNVLLKGWAQKGKTPRIKELFNLMKTADIKPNAESFAYYCLSLARQVEKPTDEDIILIIDELNAGGVNPKHLFNKCYLTVDEKDMIIDLLKRALPSIRNIEIQYPEGYSCKLMDVIEQTKQKFYNHCEGIDLSGLESAAKQQFALEISGNILIKSIVSDDLSDMNDKTKNFLRNQWKKSENEWRVNLKEAFLRNIKSFQTQSNEINGMTLYPYLMVLDTHYYVDAIIEEIRSRANMSEYYSPPMSTLFASLGKRLMLRYLVKTHIRDGTAQDLQQLYEDYLDYHKDPNLVSTFNPRQYWQKLMADNQHHYNDNSRHKIWPFHVQVGVGQFLYNLMVQEVKLDANVMRLNTQKRRIVPAFGMIYKSIGHLKYQKELRVLPTVSKLFRKACLDNLLFDINMLPMLCPPTPWISPKFGGYLLTKTDFVRMPDSYQKWIYSNYDKQSLSPTFDSLNYLSMCPWILNSKVLDIAIHFFKKKGNQSLSIPKPLSEFPPLPKIDQSLPKTDKIQSYRQRNQQKREMSESYSLWCDCLYKLSIANHFRNKVFWFPNNLDFRGRVYPVPPHFNHLGSDMTRSLIMFAKGQPLGERGLDWLKIHLINLTGLKKRSSVAERLAFANEILTLIIDSADNPLDGCKWWMESDEPWQTLSCAIEIANAVRSPDPTQYVCHLPVHQDGSCNGLQHYAALGRDQAGAESVNLFPADRPQDVYSDVAALVEKQRAADALGGHEIAKLLEGYIGRKIVKQTVMTYVYGVTRFGAKLQIFKRLKETESFPKDRAFVAAIYLTQSTFQSIQEMFTETRAIQDWLTDCARIISKVYEKPVEWVTPLGFPVIQPYHKPKTKVGETFMGIGNETSLKYLTNSDVFQKPNTLKQKNAFPPNFIHSLDSTHMMLTSLHCQKEGLTFASVHDCFWTHPNCVETMNSICRQQFVALHSEPILDNLAKHFSAIYAAIPSNTGKSDVLKSGQVLGKQLNKGSFDLQQVLNSVYFFS